MMNRMRVFWVFSGVCTAGVLVLLATPHLAIAMNTLTQGYNTTKQLPLGTLVSLVKNTTDSIEPSSTQTLENMLGIVVSSDSSLLTVTDGTNSQVQVATTGTVPALVSDINSEIKDGDHITASPMVGVGIKHHE